MSGFIIAALVLVLGAASPAQAGTDMCSFYKKNPTDTVSVVDGNDPFVRANLPGSSFGIDMNCEFVNFPISSAWPNGLTPTLNFYTPDKDTIYLVAFDNVWYSGNMACANIYHKLWVVNSEEGAFSGACQNLMVPAETIAKQSPAATAMIGLPFTYTLTLPSMNFRPGTPSSHDLGAITVVDDLGSTGADLTLVSLNAHYKGTTTAVPITQLSDSTNKYLHFTLPNIAAGSQVVVEVTAVLNDTPANVPGLPFTNTARWSFARWIDLDEDGIQDAGEYFNPLPGESGISTPMTIVAPNLVVNKTSLATAINLGDTAAFTIDVQNSGGGDAWNPTIIDNIPVGMCAFDPTVTVNAEIVAAGGTPGTGTTLTKNTDYSVAYNSCQLSLTMLTERAKIAPELSLIVTYQTQLDPGFTNDGATLTNVAGATQWFSASSTNAGRRVFTRTLTDGTPAVVDFQDSQSVTAALHGYYFEKTVRNLTSLENPATTATPGDTLHYRLRAFNVDQTINTITISDTLNLASFDPATLRNVTITPPAGYTAGWTFNSTSGLLQIFGVPALDVKVGGQLVVEFDITLRTGLANGTTVSNQATLSAAGGFTALSDDPYLNGVAPPDGTKDPTNVTIRIPGPLAKANTKPAATIGERFEYIITVPADPASVPLYDVRVLDTLPANLRFVSARVATGGAWVISNTGTGNSLILEDTTTTGIDISVNGQARIAVTVELLNNVPNQSSVTFNNSALYTYNRANGVDSTKLTGGAGTTANMTVVEPRLAAAKTARFVSPAGKLATDPAMVGDVLEYKITIPNSGTSTAFDANIFDTLPANLTLVAGSAAAAINGAAVTGFVANPYSPSGTTLVWGRGNGDGTLDIPAGQSLVLTYQVRVEDAPPVGSFTNNAWVDWTSLDEDYPIDITNPAPGRERTGAGCPGTTLPNDYCTGPASVTVYTTDKTSIVKSVNTDSYAETPTSTTDPIVRVGDTVTYDLTLNLQEYTTRNVVVEDALPAGMALQSFTITKGSNNISYLLPLAAEPAAGATGTLRWVFGDIINSPDGISTDDTLVIRYVAKVLPDAPTAGVGYNSSILLDNQAKLSFTGGDPTVYPARLTTTKRVDVRQPIISTIAKTGTVVGRTASGDGSNANPYQVIIATDEMKFQLKSCNTGLAPAYGVQLTDVLASQLNETSITTPVVAVDGTILTDGRGYTSTAPTTRGGSMIFVLNAPVNPDKCVTVDYNIGFHTDFGPNQTWNNSVSLNKYASLPADGRIYASTATAQVWMTNVVTGQSLIKKMTAPTSGEATIGETVTYQITVPGVPMNTELSNVVVTDTLHGALAYLSATVAAPFTLLDATAGQNVSLTIAQIPAGQQAVITLTARVANNDQANGGTSFTNTASYTYTNIPAGSVTSGTSGPLTIVEPSVTVAKSVNPSTPPTAGDILTYTVNLKAASGANFSSVFDIGLVDTLSLGLEYVNFSARVAGVAVEPVVNLQTLTWSGIDIPEGTTVAVTYQVRVLDTVVAGQTLTNSVTARWTGLDADNAYERTGSGTPSYNDYAATAAAPPLTIPIPVLTLQKTVDKPIANPGDRLRYTIVIQNPTAIRLDNFSLVDEIERLNAQPRFQANSIGNVVVPAGATSVINGGTLNVKDLNIGPKETLTVVFEAVLATNLKSDTVVLNQAELHGPWPAPIKSDDPNVSGAANPTQTIIPANGVVYDAVTRKPLGGATLTMRLASTGADLPTSCFVDSSQQNQVTPANGTYKFDLNFSQPECPAGSDYLIAVSAVLAGHVAEPSLIIKPASTTAYSVPVCSADAIPSTDQCEALVSATAPTGAVTTHYLNLTLDPTRNQIFNNHIPVDPYIEQKIYISKTSPLINVTRGQLVPYTITIKNTLRSTLPALGVIDTLPAGFKYVAGSGRVDETPREPVINGRQLRWNNLDVGYNQPHTIKLLLVVGAGVTEGKYVNLAQVININMNTPFSEVATATVRVIPDPDFDGTDVIGKVFDDRNLNGFQDTGEKGLPGVRVVTARGLIATTDEHGRFHITSAVVPDEDRGSNFILKLDDRSLPTGYRVTTENPRVQRATRGKMVRFNFGATMHHVVSLDLADGVFEPDSAVMRLQWIPSIPRLIEGLEKSPSVLRLSYLADVEPETIVRKRLDFLKQEIERQWALSKGGYRLTIETEVFWRRGSPPGR
ncbi:MAG: isopeptide-forming domain-containing fimbrial protein [Desulfuromonadaceae bacterium]